MPTTPSISELIKLFPLQNINVNGIDVIMFILILFYAIEGYGAGLLDAFLDLISFIISFVVGIKFYALVGKLLASSFALTPGVANAVSFFLIALFSEFLINIFLRGIVSRLLAKSGLKQKQQKVNSAYLKLNRLGGLFMGVFSSLILLSFILTVIFTFPFSPVLKKAVSSSIIANALAMHTQELERSVNSVFGQAIVETINFLTVKPQSDETVNLNFKTTKVLVDPQAEVDMLKMVNKQRVSRGLSEFVAQEALADVARRHAKDMFARGYFSHYTKEGYSPFDRLALAGISYSFAGENLAFAPNTVLAMQGLMDSKGHRENILSTNFGRVGIGVVDGGIYGEMFVQEFTN